MPGASRQGLSDEEAREVRETAAKQQALAETSTEELLAMLAKGSPRTLTTILAACKAQDEEWSKGLNDAPPEEPGTVGSDAQTTLALAESEERSAEQSRESRNLLALGVRWAIDNDRWPDHLPSPPETVRRIRFHDRAYERYRKRAQRLRQYAAETPSRLAAEAEERRLKNRPLQEQIDELRAELAKQRKD